MKQHRIIQLIGLCGILFLVPFMQELISNYSSEKEDAKREQVRSIIEHIYYDVKSLTCIQLGQEATSHDCNKGVYQDILLKLAIDQEKEAENKKSDAFSTYWIMYFIFASLLFLGPYIEYRREYIEEQLKR